MQVYVVQEGSLPSTCCDILPGVFQGFKHDFTLSEGFISPFVWYQTILWERARPFMVACIVSLMFLAHFVNKNFLLVYEVYWKVFMSEIVTITASTYLVYWG